LTVTVMPAAVIVAERVTAAVLAAAVKTTVPGPVPLAPAVIVSHAALLVAVQPHVDAEAPMATCPGAPVAATVCDPGEAVNVQAGGGAGGSAAPACVTVTARPAIVTVAVRVVVDVLAVALTRRSPVPDPPSELVVTQAAPDVAVHAHEAADAVTEIGVDAAAASIATDSGATVKVQGGGSGGLGVGGLGVGGFGVGGLGVGGVAPTCVTVNTRPAMASVPMRADVDGLALVRNRTTLGPVPALLPTMETQSMSLAAVQGHVAVV
jgi:hypothetical protein